jgi:hypothetical protein
VAWPLASFSQIIFIAIVQFLFEAPQRSLASQRCYRTIICVALGFVLVGIVPSWSGSTFSSAASRWCNISIFGEDVFKRVMHISEKLPDFSFRSS